MQRSLSRALAALTQLNHSTSIIQHCSTPSVQATCCIPVVFSRAYLPSTSTLRTSRTSSPRDVPLDVIDAPPSAAQVARRNAASEQAKRDSRQHRQLPYNAYNIQLSRNIKQLDTWAAILSLLHTELNETAYNKQTAALYVPLNKKYTQLTHQTLQAATLQLIKFRRTRHRVTSLPNPQLMHTLAQFIRVLEMSAPAMYEGKANGGRWRMLYHPYRYLRAVVEQWRKAAVVSARQAKQREAERKEEEAIRQEGGLTPDDIRRRIAEVRQKRMERQAARSKGEEAEDQRPRDDLVAAMRGLPTKEEERELAGMTDDEKMRAQVRMILEEGKQSSRREKQQKPERKEEEVKPPARERRRAKPPSFFSAPR